MSTFVRTRVQTARLAGALAASIVGLFLLVASIVSLVFLKEDDGHSHIDRDEERADAFGGLLLSVAQVGTFTLLLAVAILLTVALGACCPCAKKRGIAIAALVLSVLGTICQATAVISDVVVSKNPPTHGQFSVIFALACVTLGTLFANVISLSVYICGSNSWPAQNQYFLVPTADHFALNDVEIDRVA